MPRKGYKTKKQLETKDFKPTIPDDPFAATITFQILGIAGDKVFEGRIMKAMRNFGCSFIIRKVDRNWVTLKFHRD